MLNYHKPQNDTIMSNKSKAIRSQDDSNVLSKAIILEDNDNKKLIINKIRAYKDSLLKNRSKVVQKDEVIRFVECIEPYIQQSHDVTMETLPHGTKKYKTAMQLIVRVNENYFTSNTHMANNNVKPIINDIDHVINMNNKISNNVCPDVNENKQNNNTDNSTNNTDSVDAWKLCFLFVTSH
jgi:hypothetical protein